jgi:hypothetical protein
LSERHHSLRCLSGKCQGSDYSLADPSEIVVGRSGDADLVLLEGMVSRRHARFSLSGGTMAVEDLGSINGTFVNGKKVTKRVELAEGDRVLIGTSILKVVLSSAPRATPAHAPELSVGDEQTTAARTSVSGDMSDVGVFELLESVASGGDDVVVELDCTGSAGFIRVCEGRVRDCGFDKLRHAPRMKMLLRLLSYNRGKFCVRPATPAAESRLDLDVAELLVDARRHMDELDVIRQRLPEPNEVLVIARPLLAPLTALEEADLVLLTLAHNAGRVERILDQSEQDDVEVARRLLALIDRGYLRKR